MTKNVPPLLAVPLSVAIVLFGARAARSQPAPADVGDAAPKLVLETQGFTTTVNCLDFSPDGHLLAAGGSDKTVRIWDMETGRLKATLRGFSGKALSGACQALAFSPDGAHLLVGVQDFSPQGAVRVYKLSNLDEIESLLPGHGALGVNALAFSPDGAFLASVGADEEVILWDWPNRRRLGSVRIRSPIRYLGFPTAARMLVAFDAGGFHTWSARHARLLDELTPQQKAELGAPALVSRAIDSVQEMSRNLGRVTYPYQGQPMSISAFPDQGFALIGGKGKKEGRDHYWVGLWSTRDGARLQLFEKHTYIPTGKAALIKGGWLAATGDVFGDIHVWETQSGKVRWTFRGKGNPIFRVGFDSAGQRLGIGTTTLGPGRWGFNNYADFEQSFDLRNRQVLPVAEGAFRTEQVRQGRHALSLTSDRASGLFVLQSTREGRVEGQYAFPRGVTPLSYSLLRSGGTGYEDLIALGQSDNQLNLRDPATMMVRRDLIGHEGPVNSVGQAPDAPLLVSGSSDRTLRFWPLGKIRPDAFPDFETYIDSKVCYMVPGGPSERAGIRPGDRHVKLDGKDLNTLTELWLSGRWPYKQGQRVSVDMERAGRPYRVEVELTHLGDFAEPTLSLFIAGDDWVLWTPQGYYDASPGGDRLIGWHVNRGRDQEARFYLAQQFRKPFYRPDIIDQVLKTGDVPQAIARANAVRTRPAPVFDLRRPEVIQRLEPPMVRLLGPIEGTTTKAPMITVEAEVVSTNDQPITGVKVLVNGQPARFRERGRGPGDEGDKRRLIDREVELFPGRNVIAIVATNPVSNSRPVTVTVRRDVPQPARAERRLYLLAIGVSEYADPELKLDFAHRDAQEFAKACDTQKDGLYTAVETRVLCNREATVASIRDGMDWLRENVAKDDLALIFISAHGLDDANGNYYIATHEVNPRRINATTIPSNDLIRLVEGLRCRRAVFLDVCHAGGNLAGRVDAADAFRDLVSEEVGAIMFGSSTPRGTSQESPQWRHGAFTKAILDTLKDQQTYDGGMLTAYDLIPQIDRRVRKLTNNSQHPVNRIAPNCDNFELFQYVPAIAAIGLRPGRTEGMREGRLLSLR